MRQSSYLLILLFCVFCFGCRIDNDPDPYRGSVSFSVSSTSVVEGQTFDLVFNLDGPNLGGNPVVVLYLISGTANGDDHGGASGLITIPIGESSSTRLIETYADTIPEGDESIIIKLDEIRLPDNITLTESPTIVVTLQDSN